jgi:hypothetical protein
MNCNSPFFRYVADNGLEYIQPFMTGAKDGVLVLTGSESVYTCLEKLEGYKPVAKYVVVNNEKNRNCFCKSASSISSMSSSSHSFSIN